MQKPPLDPHVDDTAPTDAALTVYDAHESPHFQMVP